MLECENLYAGYEDTDVIQNISLKVASGDMLCVTGPNGCGKSTLLKALCALSPRIKGSVKINGEETSNFKRKELARKIALMTQVSSVYFPYTVYETTAMSRYAHTKGFFKTLSLKDKEVINETLRKLELESVKDKLINELSGGQLQRVFLARTMAQDPDIILLDEPTNHLDLKHQIELLEYLCEWVKTGLKSVIGVFHDLNLALSFFETTALMHQGKIIETGGTKKIFTEEKIKKVYGINIQKFMLSSLEKWKV
ncbi:MAG: ABC transporter ATP-binding protein [Spirochaetaceae bacterium]|jgi:iron complex transport system ATP-binding protein|nr:ABC transporter ATP-binding protein [Spirochaetaceae bacterium]